MDDDIRSFGMVRMIINISGLLAVLLLCRCKNTLTDGAVYDVSNFGAVGDSVTVNTLFIQRAIDACASNGGGTVYIPEGCFSSAALFLKTNVSLEIGRNAKLRAIAGIGNYPTLKGTRIAGIEM